ncbi:hypothetical protein BRD01_02905 [Halobacteriales archaeon QS_8_65_32]|nr:MAG: hypothetical protein BRD01_02905 [Halobacteriales archaeon QS_8_65_32]
MAAIPMPTAADPRRKPRRLTLVEGASLAASPLPRRSRRSLIGERRNSTGGTVGLACSWFVDPAVALAP